MEKDALAGVLAPIASEFHVTMMVNRGYSSQSAMYEAGKRYIENCQDGRYPHLIYLGDMDPSGEDMVRDISDRLDVVFQMQLWYQFLPRRRNRVQAGVGTPEEALCLRTVMG